MRLGRESVPPRQCLDSSSFGWFEAAVPLAHQWTAPVWQADLDAFGELRTVTILRLLQEAATQASTDAGFDTAYYARTASMWIVRRTRLSLFEPARYGDHLTVRTWIADFRRVRSQREYEVRAGERLIARASSDWVFVDRVTSKPRRIPPEWEATFGLAPATDSLREPFPKMTPPATAHATSRRIDLHDLDPLRHVNNSNYAAYVEQALFDLLGESGWNLESQITAGGRLRIVEHDLEYLDAALYGERVGVRTWITGFDGRDMTHHTHLHRADPHRPLLQARSRYRWTSHDGVALPPLLKAALQLP